jgi:TetR/AcrR family transcriptional regulator
MEQQDERSCGSADCACAPAEQQDERTRERLIRAAVAVFDRKGYSASSVREIVELAGVAKPALYYHFRSKDGLLVTILEAAAQEFSRATGRAIARPGTARERLLAFAVDLHGLFQQNVPVVRVAHTVFFGPVEGVPAFDFTKFDREMEVTVRRILEEGQATGEIRRDANSVDLAVIIMGIIGSIAMRQLHKDVTPLGVDTINRVFALVFDGALPGQRQQGEQGQ